MKPGEMPYSILWKGVCWLHTTKSACEARLEASEAVLAGVVWLHFGEKAEIRAKNLENGAGEGKEKSSGKKPRLLGGSWQIRTADLLRVKQAL